MRIPKPFRILCFKNYLSPEEREEIRKKKEREEEQKRRKDLTLRVAIKPTVDGYQLEDSFFSDNPGVTKDDSKARLKLGGSELGVKEDKSADGVDESAGVGEIKDIE